MKTTDDGHPSTTWGNDRATVPLGPKGQQHSRRRRRPWGALRQQNRRFPVTVTLTYVGGSEPWVRVQSRGEVGYMTLDRSLDFLIRRVCNEGWDGIPE